MVQIDLSDERNAANMCPGQDQFFQHRANKLP